MTRRPTRPTRPIRAVLLAGLTLASAACPGRQEPDLAEAPRRFTVEDRLTGPAERGFGAAVAWEGSEPRVGAPWQGAGAVYGPQGVLLEGVDGDRLGETLLGGASLVVGAPGRAGDGALLDASGQVTIAGQSGEHFGGAPVQHGDELVALGLSGAVGSGGTSFSPQGGLWSLASVQLSQGAEPVLIGGLRSGGVAWPSGRRDRPGALGRGLLGCDVDRDGDQDLVLADPLTGHVDVHVLDDPSALDLDAPTRRWELGPGAGRALGCVAGGVLVGAPDQPRGGAIHWLRNPLESDPPEVIFGSSGRLGHSLAVGPERVLVGDPRLGEALILAPAR